jgi:hypothetical protein
MINLQHKKGKRDMKTLNESTNSKQKQKNRTHNKIKIKEVGKLIFHKI